MTTKMKGLMKGIKHFSQQIFDEEKEQEIQIGLPTDVKHVAHIGWDGGPAVDSAPSWMKDFKSTPQGFSAPLGPPGDSKDNPEIQWVSEDSKRGIRSQDKDIPELPKSSRRQSSQDYGNSNDQSSLKKKEGKTKKERKSHHAAKDSPDGGESSQATEIPKKTRRKKSKDSGNEAGTRKSKNKGTTSSTSTDASTDPGLESGPLVQDSSSHSTSLDNKKTEHRVTFRE